MVTAYSDDSAQQPHACSWEGAGLAIAILHVCGRNFAQVGALRRLA